MITFDGAPTEGHINFGVGQPSADLLPVDLIREANQDYLASAQALEFNYGVVQGDERFRESLAGFLTRHYEKTTRPETLCLSAGNSHALDFVCTQFSKPGDTVFVEDPSYFLAFQIFRDHGLNIVGIPVDEQGMQIAELEKKLQEYSPALVYTIPSFLNPGGQNLSESRREQLVNLSQEHGFVILADEVYQLLHYTAKPPPALGSMLDRHGDNSNIISLGSFSKILAPGLRLGWIQTAEGLMQKLLSNGTLNSGGSFNHFTSHVVRHAIDLGLLDRHLHTLREVYGSRVEVMDSALQAHLGDFAKWHKPEGGYFFWLECPPGTDTTELRREAQKYETGFQPGPVFSCDGAHQNCLRLSFAHYSEQAITAGVARLASLLRNAA
jgi:2-aminoadipate transaminase